MSRYGTLMTFGYVFGSAIPGYITWKQKDSSHKMENRNLRQREKPSDNNNSAHAATANSGGFLDVDIAILLRIIFEETFLVFVFGTLASLADYFFLPYVKDNSTAFWTPILPLGLFLAFALIRPYEHRLLVLSPESKNVIVSKEKLATPMARLHRLAFNMVFLIMLITFNFASSAALIYETESHEEFDLSKFDMSPALRKYIMILLVFSMKFAGSCATVVVYRMYVEIAILAYTYGMGRTLKTEVEKEPQRQRHQQIPLSKDLSSGDINANERMDDLNANTFPEQVRHRDAFDRRNYQRFDSDY